MANNVLPLELNSDIIAAISTAIDTGDIVTESNDRVWRGTPALEQAQDPQRNGIGLIIDLVRVVGLGKAPESNFVMERAAT